MKVLRFAGITSLVMFLILGVCFVFLAPYFEPMNEDDLVALVGAVLILFSSGFLLIITGKE